MQKTQIYKAIKYIRLSYTDDKTVESDSVANQRRLIDDFIEKHPEIEVVGEKIDDGYSGVLFDRPAFQEMMRMIEDGQVNCVIVKDLSRLGREYIETGRYMRRVFPAYGVRFIAINDNVDTLNDAADDLAVSVKNIMNEAYCRDISIKTRSALDVKRRSGDFVGAFAVYGYIKTGDKHKSLEVDPYASKVVQDIFRMRLDGFSASHIAEELNRMGILSPLAYKHIVDERIVYGCVSMPSNVFATTGTNVSVLFFDNSRKTEKVVLIDASKMGEEYKDGNNQKRRLRDFEIEQIVSTLPDLRHGQ